MAFFNYNTIAGVAILISKRWQRSFHRVYCVSDRVMAIECIIGSKLTRLICINLQSMAIIIGIYFKSSSDGTSRGLRLQSLVDEYALQICDDPAILDAADA